MNDLIIILVTMFNTLFLIIVVIPYLLYIYELKTKGIPKEKSSKEEKEIMKKATTFEIILSMIFLALTVYNYKYKEHLHNKYIKKEALKNDRL